MNPSRMELTFRTPANHGGIGHTGTPGQIELGIGDGLAPGKSPLSHVSYRRNLHFITRLVTNLLPLLGASTWHSLSDNSRPPTESVGPNKTST